MVRGEPPTWWDWDLEVSPHLLKRMVDRRFNESDLREMLEDAGACEPNAIPGRWKIATHWRGESWEIVVEPDEFLRRVVVVTAYAVE